MSVSVSEVQIAVHSFAVCVHNVNEWMRASRLWLNPTKTQVMWLGSGQQLKHVETVAEPDQDPGHVARLRPAAEACRHQRHPVVAVQVVENTRDLGVILDSR